MQVLAERDAAPGRAWKPYVTPDVHLEVEEAFVLIDPGMFAGEVETREPLERKANWCRLII